MINTPHWESDATIPIDGKDEQHSIILCFQESVCEYIGPYSVSCFIHIAELFWFPLLLWSLWCDQIHYGDVIMSAIASQITSLASVFSTAYSDADQRNHQSSASLAFVRGIHRGPVNSPHRWPVRRKMSPYDDVMMKRVHYGLKAVLRGLFVCTLHYIIIVIMQKYLNSLNIYNACQVYSVECV